MKKFWLGLIFFIGCYPPTNPVMAEPIYAIANLGGAKYAEVMRDAHPAGFGNVTFTNTFGDAYQAIDRLLATGKVPVQEYALSWSDAHSFSRRDFPKIVSEARRFVPLVNKYLSVECLFNPAVEHNLRASEALALMNQVLAVLPQRCKVVNNPYPQGGGQYVPGTSRILNEVHGHGNKPNVPGKYIFNFDGTAAEDADVESVKQKHKSAYMFALWSPRFNGRWESNDTTPRPLRKGWPDKKMIQSITALAKPKGITNLPRDGLYKSHAENKGNNDPRAEKPVIILKQKARSVFVGPVECPYYGVFTDGRARYYCNKWGYEIANIPINMKIGNKIIGKINPAFRDGSWRD